MCIPEDGGYVSYSISSFDSFTIVFFYWELILNNFSFTTTNCFPWDFPAGGLECGLCTK